MKVAVAVLGLLVVAVLAVRWWSTMRSRRRWSSFEDFPARREVEAAVALADGLPGRLERVGDPGAVAVALTGGGFPRECVEDLDEDVALLALLADDAARRAAKAELPAALLRRVTGRPLPGEQRLRDAAQRSIEGADAALTRLEAVAARLSDRQALLDGGRDEVLARLAQVEQRLAPLERAAADERLPEPAGPYSRAALAVFRREFGSRPAPLLAAGAAGRRELVDELRRAAADPRASYAALRAALARLEGRVDTLARDLELARQEALREQQRAARERAVEERAARVRAEQEAARAAAPGADTAAVEAARRAQEEAAVRAARLAAQQRFPHPA